MTFQEAKEKLLADDNVRREYETLDEEYEHIMADLRKIASKNPTGKERLEKLYAMLVKAYPTLDIRFKDWEREKKYEKYQVAYYETYYGDDVQICDAIWGWGSYGYEQNLLEYYDGKTEPIGWIKERKTFNLFKKCIEREHPELI